MLTRIDLPQLLLSVFLVLLPPALHLVCPHNPTQNDLLGFLITGRPCAHAFEQQQCFITSQNNNSIKQKRKQRMQGSNHEFKMHQSTYQDFVNTSTHFPVHQSYQKFNKTQKMYYQTRKKELSLREHPNGTHQINQDITKRDNESAQKREKRFTVTTQKLYQAKKNAYKNYIREIYNKINDQLKKKNTFLTIATQNIKHIDCTLSLTTKEVKPIKAEREKSEEIEQSNLKKMLRSKLKFQKLQDETASIERIRQKLVALKKEDEREKKQLTFKKQQIALSKTQREIKHKEMLLNKEQSTDHYPKREFFKEKRRERIYSLNTTLSNHSSKINVEDYILNKFLFHKKDPFVCGLNEKLSVQEKIKEKILNYLDFLWKINYSNGIFIKSQPEETTYKAYIGSGNNSIMVKSILKRRFWWTITDKPEGSNFVWTQLKVNSIFRQHQTSSKAIKQHLYTLRTSDINSILTHNPEYEQDVHSKIFNAVDLANWNDHLSRNTKNQIIINERTYLKRLDLLTRKNITKKEDNCKMIVHNHLEQNYFIGNKKALFYNMRRYYKLKEMNIFDSLPLTFHIVKGVEDPQYKLFFNYYAQLEQNKKNGDDEKNIWIIKPGEFSNRGNGISICYSLDDILVRLRSKQKSNDGNLRTFILQKYIEKPLLYKSRKFDIRHYMLITCFNGIFKAYWYPQGYIRTSSSHFNLKRSNNLFVHLTNDAIQKNSDEYGKYEKGNKITYEKFQVYLDKNRKNGEKNVFFDKILPEMKELAINAVKSTYFLLDSKRREHNFQLLGMDFMIDQSLKPWLIEINTNPCLELSCPLLSKIIPSLIQNTFKICIDPFYPPPEEWSNNKKFYLSDNTLDENRFELIFDESVEGREIEELYHGNFNPESTLGKIEQDAQIYENDGVEEWQGETKKEND